MKWFFGIRINHVLASREWQVVTAWVGPNLGSEHRPVFADLQLRQANSLSLSPRYQNARLPASTFHAGSKRVHTSPAVFNGICVNRSAPTRRKPQGRVGQNLQTDFMSRINPDECQVRPQFIVLAVRLRLPLNIRDALK